MQEGKVATEPVKETKGKRAKPKPAPATSDLQVSGQELGSLEEGGGELMMQNHAALLGDPRISHPTNSGRRAGMVTQLQRRYGNTYVQRVVEYLQTSVGEELEEKSFEELAADTHGHEDFKELPAGATEQKLEKSSESAEDLMPQMTDGVAQRASAPGLQRQVEEEEEPIQAEWSSEFVQRQEEEEIQEVADSLRLQRQVEEEEEPVQPKPRVELLQQQEELEEEEALIQTEPDSKSLQRQIEEEEETVQEKVAGLGLQRQPEEEEEEPVQEKAAGLGLQQQPEEEEEEEPIQAEPKNQAIQPQIEEEEEPIQAELNSQSVQRQEEEEPVQEKASVVRLQRQMGMEEEVTKTDLENKISNEPEESVKRRISHGHIKSPPILQRMPAAFVQRQAGGPPIPLGGKVFQERTICEPNLSVGGLPIKFKAVKVGGELSVSMARQGAGSTQVGFESSGEEHAVTVEHTEIWDQATTPFGDVTIQSKGEAKVTTKGNVEVGLEVLGAQFQNGSAFTLKLNVFSTDREKSEINILNAVVSRAFSPIKGTTTASNGATLNWEAKGTVSLVFEPDYAKIGRWVAEKFGKEAAAELGMAGAFVAGGILTIAAALVNIAQRDEPREWTDEAIRLMNEYCTAFQGTLAKTDWSVSTEIGFDGEVAARNFLKQAQSPPEAIHEEAKKRSFRGEAFAKGWPQVKSLILKRYLEEHPVQEFFYGKKGQGYRLLEQVLDTVDEEDLDIKPGEKSYY